MFQAYISVNWTPSPRIVTVAAPEVAVTIQDLYDTLRTLEAEPYGVDEPSIVSGAGKEPLGGGLYVGLTVTLLNARLAFEARPGPSFVQCQVSGGNLVAVDALGAEMNPIQTTAYTQVIMAASSSSTLLEGEISADEVAEAVWARSLEGSFTAKQLVRLMSAALAGKLSGAGTTTITIRDVNDAINRIVAGVDADGNRLTVTKDVSGP
jgi:hypothetical protein